MTEDEFERNYVVKWLAEMDYKHLFGPDIDPNAGNPYRANFKQVVLEDHFKESIRSLNPNASEKDLEEAYQKITNFKEVNLVQKNRAFHKYLLNGVELDIREQGDKDRQHSVRIIDLLEPKNNNYLVVNQFTVIDKENRRPDVVVFVNGLPLFVFELKNPSDQNVDIWDAYNQFQTYKNDISDLFIYNVALFISDGWKAKIGSLTAEEDRYMPWRAIKGQDDKPVLEFEVENLVKGFFQHDLILEYIKNFVLFADDGENLSKMIAGYHQYHGVKAATDNIVKASRPKGSKKGGVFWHTQGSGKSLSMTCLAGLLINHTEMENPTIVVVTDRNDLDGQLYETFDHARELLGQAPAQADGRDELREMLHSANSGGIYFTTIQKFTTFEQETDFPVLSDRHNVVVMADEAHRSQYGLKKKLDKKSNTFKFGYASNMRRALPNATFIAFTGTPVSEGERFTEEIFGKCISIYDIQDAVEDGATVKIYYESRLAKIDLNDEVIRKVDQQIEDILEDEDLDEREKEKGEWASLEKLVGSQKRIEEVAGDIVKHYEHRTELLEGKAMIVCMSREICAQMYDAFKKLKPEWHSVDYEKGQMKVIMTGSAADSKNLQPHIYSKAKKKKLEKRFKKPSDELKIVLVCDMWLTGFDVPCCHTMYIDKPMKGHNLMQAIARVNRVFGEKTGGIIVDYIGIAGELKNATLKYSKSKGKGRVTTEIEQSFGIVLEQLDVIRGMLHGINYKAFEKDPNSLILPVANFILGLTDGKKRFYDEVLCLDKAYTLCSTHDDIEPLRNEIAFYQAVKVAFKKTDDTDDRMRKNKRYGMMKQILDNSIVSKGVENIFSLAGMDAPDISILDDKFLESLKNSKYQNFAVELLKKLLHGEIKSRLKTNIVQEKKFSERLEKALHAYVNRTIESAQIIEELIRMAKDFREAMKRGEKLGLNRDEEAFYDALANDEEAARELDDEILKKIAMELTEKIRKNTSVDWQYRESVQAKLRNMVRVILRKYKYPPSKSEEAVALVLAQATKLADKWSVETYQ